MTTILNLPEELLTIIFKELPPNSQKQCQWVCKTWDVPAHRLYLKNIHIPVSKIRQFVSSIDANPHPAYLRSVESIDIRHDRYQKHLPLDEEMIKKLFYRFPNLKDATIAGPADVYNGFNDTICKTILKKCPKLDTFAVHITFNFPYYQETNSQRKKEIYADTLYKLRFLLTKMGDPTSAANVLGAANTVDFLTRFPRLQSISNIGLNIDNFQQLLPAFTQLSNLKTIVMEDLVEEQHHFSEMYLATKTIDEQQQMSGNLSRIKTLEITYDNIFCVNSIEFISKYFIGLDSFGMASFNSHELNDRQRAMISDTIVDIICSTNTKGDAYFSRFYLEDIANVLAATTSRLFQQTASKTILEVRIDSDYASDDEDSLMANFTIVSDLTNSLRKIIIHIPRELDLYTITPMIAPSDDIDKLIVNNTFNEYITTDRYDRLLAKMPSLKEVELEIPPSYVYDSTLAIHRLIETMTLRITAGEKSQQVIDGYSTKFPNLKQLTMFYFCGTWNQELHKYQLSLSNYSLDRLALDLTPIKLEMDKRQEHEKNGVIVVQVSATSSNEIHYFKLSLLQSKLTKTVLNESDLTTDDSCFRIHITIDSLQRLDIYLCSSYIQHLPEYNPYYANQNYKLSCITVFNK